MKKTIALVVLLITALSIGVYATLASLNTTGKAANTVTSGNIKIELSDDYETDGDIQPIIMPSTVMIKDIAVENIGNKNCYVKIKLSDEFLDEEGNKFIEDENSDQITYSFSDDENWTLGNDGFVYYNNILKPSENTGTLKVNMNFSSNLSEEAENGILNTFTKAYAVQSDNNELTDGETVLDINGWPID